VKGVSILPDSNIWRYIVDADAVETIRKAAQAANVNLVACPAVVYECLRVTDVDIRRRLAMALTRTAWLRPMPDAFMEAEQFRAELARLRPEWLVAIPKTRSWRAQRDDWCGFRGGFWWRVRNRTGRMARHIGVVGDGKLDRARDEATVAREEARNLGHTIQGLRLDTANAWYLCATPGWDGAPFEAWRGRSQLVWWRNLVMRGNRTMLDWLEPWFDLDRIRAEPDRWVTFWTRECAAEYLPREWLRWAMSEVQALRKVTPGTPVDNQISTYLVDYDVFVTADRAFAECVEAARPYSPIPLAITSTSPAGSAAVDHLLNLFDAQQSANESGA
jgi:hypothetical protein